MMSSVRRAVTSKGPPCQVVVQYRVISGLGQLCPGMNPGMQARMLDAAGGNHEVSWHGRALERKCVVPAVWCLLDEKGEEVGRGKTATVREALQHLVTSLSRENFKGGRSFWD